MITFSDVLRYLAGSFFGTVGFAWLTRVPKKAWLPSGMIASAVYMIYWLLPATGLSENLAVFLGSLLGSLAGHVCARRMHMINTVFLMSAIVPVVPGLGLYRMMAWLGQGETALGADQGVRAMIIIAMTALGLVMGSFADQLIHREK